MIQTTRGVRPEEVRQGARHTLFVEGKDDGALDPTVLRHLLPDRIRVEPLGSSYHVRSAAEALHAHHPDYYFLVDRDHHDEKFVDACWRDFPDPGQSNLLVWRLRELENHFLIPEYLVRSRFLRVSEDELRAKLLSAAQRRLYLDAANLVIIRMREAMKKNWISCFERSDDFKSRDDALRELDELPEFGSFKKKVSQRLRKDRMHRAFHETVDAMTGGDEQLSHRVRDWMVWLRGKEILPAIVNGCFRVVGTDKRVIQGKDAVHEVAKDLVRRELSEQPTDFQELHRMIAGRVGSP